MTLDTATVYNSYFTSDTRSHTIQQVFDMYFTTSNIEKTDSDFIIFMQSIPSSYGTTVIDELLVLKNYDKSNIFDNYYDVISFNNSNGLLTNRYKLGSIYNIFLNSIKPILINVDTSVNNKDSINFNNSLLMLYASSIHYFMNFDILPTLSTTLSSYMPSNVIITPDNNYSTELSGTKTNLINLLTYLYNLSSQSNNLYYSLLDNNSSRRGGTKPNTFNTNVFNIYKNISSLGNLIYLVNSIYYCIININSIIYSDTFSLKSLLSKMKSLYDSGEISLLDLKLSDINNLYVTNIKTNSDSIYIIIQTLYDTFEGDITSITTYYNSYTSSYTNYNNNYYYYSNQDNYTNPFPYLQSFIEYTNLFLDSINTYTLTILKTNSYSNSAFIDKISGTNTIFNSAVLLLSHNFVQNIVSSDILTLDNYKTVGLQPDFLLLTTPVSGESWSSSDILTKYSDSIDTIINTIISNIYYSDSIDVNKDSSVSSSDANLMVFSLNISNTKTNIGILLTLIKIGVLKDNIFTNNNFITNIRSQYINNSNNSTYITSYIKLLRNINSSVYDNAGSNKIISNASFADRFSLFGIWTNSYQISINFVLCILLTTDNLWDIYSNIISNYVDNTSGFIIEPIYTNVGLTSDITYVQQSELSNGITKISTDDFKLVKQLYYFLNTFNNNYTVFYQNMYFIDTDRTTLNINPISLGNASNSNLVEIVAKAYANDNGSLVLLTSIPDYRSENISFLNFYGWGTLYYDDYIFDNTSSSKLGLDIIHKIDTEIFGDSVLTYQLSKLLKFGYLYNVNNFKDGPAVNVAYAKYLGVDFSTIINFTNTAEENIYSYNSANASTAFLLYYYTNFYS
jgi:hypothetical protein